MEILLTKHQDGFLIPADDVEAEKLRHFARGEVIRAEVKLMRNSQFHRKFFAMLRIGFDAFSPAVTEYRGFTVEKNFDQFRDDVIVAAGFYTITTSLHGKVRVKAKSIRFGRMKQESFEEVYSAVANVLLGTVLTRYTRQDLDNVVNQLLEFVQ
jgi:hypothetical protein